MSDGLNDPKQNFTIPAQQPAGLRIPEFALMNLIGVALERIRSLIGSPNDVLPKLFAFLPQEVLDQLRGWLLDHQNIYIDVSWPKDAINLAIVVVEPQGEQESTPDTFIGDRAGTTEFGVLGGIIKSSDHYAIPEKRSTSIYIGSNDDRLTLLLYELVKFIIASNKMKLEEWYDVHNLSIGGGVLEMDPEKFPTFEYYRVMSLQYLTLFDWNGVEEIAMIVSLDLLVDTRVDGQQQIVPIPNEG